MQICFTPLFPRWAGPHSITAERTSTQHLFSLSLIEQVSCSREHSGTNAQRNQQMPTVRSGTFKGRMTNKKKSFEESGLKLSTSTKRKWRGVMEGGMAKGAKAWGGEATRTEATSCSSWEAAWLTQGYNFSSSGGFQYRQHTKESQK